MKKSNILSIIAIILSLVAITMCTICCCSRDKMVAKALNNDPEMIINALQRYEQVAREKQFEALQGVIKDHEQALNSDPSSPYFGPEKAKANLVLFYDYSCGYCHRLFPVLKDLSDKNPDVKFVFKPLTFLGATSEYAAKAVLAANQQGKFSELNDALFGYQGQLTEAKIDELAAKVGVNVEQYKSDMDGTVVSDAIMANTNLASVVQIQGVPTMILGGKVVQTFDAAELQKAINAAKK